MSENNVSDIPESTTKGLTLHVNLLTAFSSLLILTVMTIVGYTYYNNSRTVLKLSDDLIHQVRESVIEKTRNYLAPASLMVEMSSRIMKKGVIPLEDTAKLEQFAIEVLKSYDQIAMFNIGDENGNFIMPKKMSDGTLATKIINRNTEPPTVTWKYRDVNYNLLRSEVSKDVKYDPRTRPWYKGAKKSRGQHWTDMYIFFTDKKPGITSAYPVYWPDGTFFGVYAMDIELGAMSDFLSGLKIGKTGIAFIINSKGEIVAYPDVAKTVIIEDGKPRSALVSELGIPSITAAFSAFSEKGSGKHTVESEGKCYITSVSNFPKSFGKDWKIVMVVPEDDFIGEVKTANKIAFLICGGILLLAIGMATIISKNISRPIVLLTEETKKIRNFELDEKVEIKSSIKEIQLMNEAVDAMKTGLQAFRRYVPAELVRQLVQTGEEATIGGNKRDLSIFFSDIAGFTTISEGMEPEKLMLHLSEYLDELTRILMSERATVDKYIGDAIMAFWGAPLPNDDHAACACRAALKCQAKLKELNEKWIADGKIPMPTRIGINTGEAVAGNVGSDERMNYTIIGDNVNLASRLEGVNKYYETSIIISEKTYSCVSDKFICRPLDKVAVKGKKQGIVIYELSGEKGDESSKEKEELYTVFTDGFTAYLNQEWDKALDCFKKAIALDSSDTTSNLYFARCMNYKDNPPGEDWDGIEHLTTK